MKKYRNRQTLLLLAAVLLFALQIPISSASGEEHIQPGSPVIRHTPVEQVQKGDDIYFSAQAPPTRSFYITSSMTNCRIGRFRWKLSRADRTPILPNWKANP